MGYAQKKMHVQRENDDAPLVVGGTLFIPISHIIPKSYYSIACWDIDQQHVGVGLRMIWADSSLRMGIVSCKTGNKCGSTHESFLVDGWWWNMGLFQTDGPETPSDHWETYDKP